MIILEVDIKTETCQSLFPVFKLCQRIFFLSCVSSHLVFESLLQAVLLSLSLSLIFFFSAITFQSLQITKSHISTLYPEDQSTLCIVALSGPRHPSQFLMLYLQNLHSCSCVKSSANKQKGPQSEAAVKGTLKMGFFVNLNLFPTLIGTLTAAVGVINKTIQLER